jgi:AraC-like DNA-binding protein
MGTATACQVVIGEMIATGTAPLDPTELVRWFADIPPAAQYSDAAMAACILIRFTKNLGALVHRRLHPSPSAASRCRFDPHGFTPCIDLDPRDPSGWHPQNAFGEWAHHFAVELGRTHDLGVQQVRIRIARNPAQPLRLAAIARDLGASTSVIRRRFASETGETPLRHQTRLRVLEAIQLIARGDKVDAVAGSVGWKGPKDLYRALTCVAHSSPGEIRRMSSEQLRGLTARIAGR